MSQCPFLKAPVELPVIGQSVPVMWLHLAMNVITQYPLTYGEIYTPISYKN